MKKLKVIVSALLVVVSIFAFTACGTFNGNFKEEATNEQLTQIKNAAGSSYSDEIDEEKGHGWIAKVSYNVESARGDESYKMSVKSESQTGVDKDNKAQFAVKSDITVNGKTLNAAMYGKDGDVYLKVGDKQAKAKTGLTGEIIKPDDLSCLDTIIAVANQALSYITVDGSVKVDTDMLKVYVDASGDTFKIKYVFTQKAILGGYGDETNVTWNGSEQSVIVVYNKDLTELKGIKVTANYGYSVQSGDKAMSVKAKIDASVEATSKAVKYPNLSKYEDMKPSSLIDMSSEILKFFGM